MGLLSSTLANAAPVPAAPAAPAAPATGLAVFSGASAPTTPPSVTLGLQPLPHQQVVGEAVAAGHRSIGLFDEMGVGKTLSAILAIETAQAYPALIICPPTLTTNWKREVQRALPARRVAVMSGTKAGQVPVADVVICPDSIVAGWTLTPDPNRRGHTLANGPLARPWGAVVQDEAHRSKNIKAQRTKAVVGICRQLPATSLRVMMTGTPMLNRPDELVPVLDALGVLKPVFGGATKFKYRYCRFDSWGKVIAADHVQELHQKLKQVAIRRLRKDVLTLPNKGRGVVHTEITGRMAREYSEAEDDLVTYLRGVTGNDKYSLAERAHAITLLNVLRRISGRAKVDAAVQQAEDLLAEGEQVFLACWHKQVADDLALRLMGHGVSVLTGDTAAASRQRAVDDFQSGKNKVFIGNIESAGVGITLTAARHIIVVELPWTPGALQQVEDRLHRIGQQRDVISTLILSEWSNGSVDDRLWRIIDGKAVTVNAVMDGVEGGLLDGDSAVSAVLDSYR